MCETTEYVYAQKYGVIIPLSEFVWIMQANGLKDWGCSYVSSCPWLCHHSLWRKLSSR